MLAALRRLFRKPAPPQPPANTIVVRAAGTASDRQRGTGLTAQQAMSIAIEESTAAGKSEDHQVKAAIDQARALFKQAKASANNLGKPVTLEIGTRRLTVEPG